MFIAQFNIRRLLLIVYMFKPKTNKTIVGPVQVTLDAKHTEFLDEFRSNDCDTIPKLAQEKTELLTRLRSETLTIEKQLDIRDRLRSIKKRIHDLNAKKNDYLLTNSKLVFDYFEDKKNIADGSAKKSDALKSFFKMSGDGDKHTIIRTNALVRKYLSNVDENYIDASCSINQSHVCSRCSKGELMQLEDEGVLICSVCATRTPYLTDNDKPSYKEAPKEICFYAYKRINHFKEILAQFQGKETTQIPPDVLANIKQQILKERIELVSLTNQKTKEILKRLGYNKYYEHIPFIKDKLGIKPPVMSPDLETTLCNLFIELQAPYSRYCPDDRVNFLNYYYTAYKLCELLGESSFLPHFSMLKDREKIIEQDAIWRQICDELDWEFIPTI